MNNSSSQTKPPIQILLLKTRSTPNDGYHDEFFSTQTTHGISFSPTFVPVLEHKILDEGMSLVRSLLKNKQIGNREGFKYGGMIFTSQRAVEAFALLVSEGQEQDPEYPHLKETPIYTVGPATSRALSSIPTNPPLSIYGKETGNGEALAHYMLSHYPSTQSSTITNDILPLLFLVGETRRDIIPKTLSANSIPVTEIPVYGTTVMSTFESSFSSILSSTTSTSISANQNQPPKTRWIIVFSPTGCEAMLRSLGLSDTSTSHVYPVSEKKKGEEDRVEEQKTYIASIGPTTRDYLKEEFGFEVDVCAERPSPEGVREGIMKFMQGKGICS